MPVGVDERAEVESLVTEAYSLARKYRRNGVSVGDVMLAAVAHRLLGGESTEALRAIAFELHAENHNRHRPKRDFPAHGWGPFAGGDDDEDDD